ncbi:MAG: class II aldolase/adducin family protein [Nitrososphaerales archaeon]
MLVDEGGMLADDVRRDLVEVCRSIYQRGLVSATGGNLSVKLGAERFLITRSGSSFRDLCDKDVLTINQDGVVVEGSGLPSTETPVHLALYKVRLDVGSVIHAHPPYATAFAAVGRAIPSVTVQASELLGEVKLIRYEHPGSEALTRLCVEVFKGSAVKCALLESHGVLVVGLNLWDAYNNLDLLEETAKIAYLSLVLKRG